MRKSFILGLLVSLLLTIQIPAQNKKKKHNREEKSGFCVLVFNNVTAMDLSHSRISSSCDASSECSAGTIVSVKIGSTFANDRYQYTVSAGKVTGDGLETIWDLSGVPPGKYTITAAALQEYDGTVITPPLLMGTTQTRAVEILDCADCPSSEKSTDK